MRFIAPGEALHPKTGERLMVPKMPVIGGPADCNVVIDELQPEGKSWQVLAHDGHLAGMPMMRCHVYRVAELDGIRSLLYMGPVGNRAPNPY